MFKLKSTVIFIVLCGCCFNLSWSESKREVLKQQFTPSKNLMQMQNLQEEPYYGDSEVSQQQLMSQQGVRYDRQQAASSSRRENELIIGEYAIYHTEYSAKIEEEIAVVKGAVNFEVFKKSGWVKIPLAESAVGLKEASLNKKPCFVIREGSKYYAVISKPGSYHLDLEFFVKVNRERERGPGKILFSVLPSPISILDVEMEDGDAEIFVEPSIKIETEKSAKKTLATVVLPYTENVTIRWSKALAKEIIPVVKLEPKLYADTVSLISIGDGVAKCFSRISYSILQSEISGLSISLPEDVGILDVSGNELRDWKVKVKDARQILDIYFNYGIKGNYTLNLVYERNIGPGSVSADLPDIYLAGAERQRGFVGIEALTNIEFAFNKLNAASVIDIKELPQDIWHKSRNPVILAFKYLNAPYSVIIDVTKHEEIPVLLAAIDSAGYVTLFTKEGKTLTKATYQMRNNVKQFIRILLPKGASLWSCFVSGKPVKPAKDKEGRVLIPLEKSQITGEALAQFPVEVVYLNKNSKLNFFGKVRMELPKLDIPANELFWSLYMPEKYSYFNFDSDLDKTAHYGFGLGGGYAPQKEMPALGMDEIKSKKGRRISKVSGIASQFSPQAAMEKSLLSEVQVIQERGALPIRIDIPQNGRLYRFGKLLVTDESSWVSVYYVRSARKALKWLFFAALFILIIILVRKFKSVLAKKNNI